MAALTEQISLARTGSPARKKPGGLGDQLFRAASYASALLVLLFLAGILASIAYGGWPAFAEFGLGFITSSSWNIGQEQYGALVAIVGTLVSAVLALLIGVPISIGIAVYLTQLCPGWARKPVSMTIELLASVPSIIYGMWGLFIFAPLFAHYVQMPVSSVVEGMPIVGTLFYARVPSGVGILTAGIILAIMIVPFVASITRDMLDQIPTVLRESAYGIGCTTWEVVRHVLVPQASVSIIGAVMLGLGRALGETMAVTFVIGNANRLSGSIFDPGSTIASRIANEFNEADGLQLNSLMALGCILFIITFIVLIIARLLVRRVKVA
ncbi:MULTISPECIES: phosphate ABC transporter permease subunit PstC [unclassified Methylobacterium]|uniref:phosphate ABC transporter permease subunit PstC n=1 Tax=unclassified Methylobacterium TaxID=2615210 RepID=UPI0006FEBCFC|nr:MULTISPECIES: phosphate ABC transporter permease subunit PstC [unclassified Methylobacterium]KQO50097.1 phosphate ABC transporter permease [Methylobacterium sp. Leaf86]KQO84889.1 phosphate ABC transporter permease [Methylobacterium sp. Leaf91]MBO1022450.1 phosphate ABC transporter permease subunit PstC [Methylobacterium sp. SD274]